MKLFSSLVGVAVFCQFAAAAAAAPECLAGKHLVRPYFPGHENGQTFDYYYRQLRAAQPGHTTVFMLTGGPGQATMGSEERFRENFPEELGVVLLDPRGVGCNRPPQGKLFPVDFYSTQHIAEDTLAVLTDLKLTHYTLYGASYGSMVASVTASLAERHGLPRPDQVVIEGVVGQDFGDGRLLAGYYREWDGLRKSFDQEDVKTFDERADFGDLTPEELGAFVAQTLIFRHYLKTEKNSFFENPLVVLSLLGFDDNQKRRDQVREAVRETAKVSQPDDAAVLAMYRAIACREISPLAWNTNLDVRFKLDRGKLVPVPSETCAGLTLDRPYHIEDWASTAPTYYFAGMHDPSTPPEQTSYHLVHHVEADRHLVAVPEGAHCALISSLTDCRKPVWQAIDKGTPLEDALKSCKFSTKTAHFKAGQQID